MQKLSKYGRAFEWRLSRGRREDLTPVTRDLVEPSHNEQLEIFEDYLYISRKRQHNRLAIAKLQLNLVHELLVAQKAIKHYKEKREHLKQEMSEATEEQKRQILNDISFVDTEIFFYRHFAQCLRLIGDGIAWRALGYDRAALRLLSQRSTKQEIISDGMVNELVEWSGAFDRRTGLAIFNPVTNWLAFGDVTVVRDDGSVEIVEVKSSNTKSRRLTRQKQGMNAVVELLKSGEGDVEEKQQLALLTLDLEVENGLTELLKLLQKASQSGFSAESVSNFLYVECVDFRIASDPEKVKADIEAARSKHLAAWERRNDVFVPMESADLIAFSPNCAPFSVFPFPEAVCVALMTGAIIYVAFLNQSEVAREFERRGWQIVRGPDDIRREVEEKHKDGEELIIEELLVVKKDGMWASLSPGDIARMQMETLRPKVLIKAREMLRASGSGAVKGLVLPTYSREAEIWR